MVNGKKGKVIDVVLDEDSQIYHGCDNIYIIDKPAAAILFKMLGDLRYNPIETLPKDVVPIFPTQSSVSYTYKGQINRFTKTQSPIAPVFAITHYRSQGRTFDKVGIDIETTRNRNT